MPKLALTYLILSACILGVATLHAISRAPAIVANCVLASELEQSDYTLFKNVPENCMDVLVKANEERGYSVVADYSKSTIHVFPL